jgi:hypothetical protein
MTVLTNEQQDKVMEVINNLGRIYWTEFIALGFPSIEDKRNIREELKKDRDKLNEVLQ